MQENLVLNYDGLFVRSIDKSQIPVCNIMGVNIAAIDMDWLLNFTEKNIEKLSGDYMCVANVHTTVTAYDNDDYKRTLNGGIMSIPDGGPLSSVGRKRGHEGMERTTGPSYMEEIFKKSIQTPYRHYFFGSTKETLNKLKNELEQKYSGIQIVGMYSPPFRELTLDEDKDSIEQINTAKPDFVWVGLGAPKQEQWMAKHQGKVNGLMVGVGAGFDYFAGNIQRAPQWMQKRNLEWLYRLMQDPKRLFSRYLYTNIKFIWKVYFLHK